LIESRLSSQCPAKKRARIWPPLSPKFVAALMVVVVAKIVTQYFTAGYLVEKTMMIYFVEGDEVNQDLQVLGLGFMTPLKISIFI
jgi:hypothetical protein